MVVPILSALSLFFQMYLTKTFFERTMRPLLQSNAICTFLLIVLVIILVDSLAVVGMALTMNVMAFAYFWMKPGNVVPVLYADPAKYDWYRARANKNEDVYPYE
jgi:K+-sensing histidine kinase KdpD